MNIMTGLAVNQDKAKKTGATVFFDNEKTCGAVVKQIHSPQYRAAIAKYEAKYKKRKKQFEGNPAQLEKVNRAITANALADTVVVSIFGFEMPGEGEDLIPIESNRHNIYNLLSMPEFDAFYIWVIEMSNSTETFGFDGPGDWGEIGKKLLSNSGTR